MLIAATWFLAAATTAGGGPELEDRAAPVDLPVAKVMVFSDRARVTRAGHVKWGAGVLRAPDLPGAVMLDTIHVSASGAKVVRVETHPVQRERWSIDQVDQWLAELESAADKIAAVQAKLENARAELAMMSSLTAAPPVPEKDRLGKATPALAPDAWRALQEHLAQRRAQARVTEKNLEKELRELGKGYDKARREVQKRDIGGFTDQRIQVLVIVEGERPEGELSVEYAMPGASWRPAYDLYFDPDKGSVELLASGLVSQATGEDWSQTQLSLSTAIPGLGIALPQLETWTLGDDRELIPTPTARTTRTPPRFNPPRALPRLADLAKAGDLDVLARHTALLASYVASPAPPLPRSTSTTTAPYAPPPPPPATSAPMGGKSFDFEDETIDGDLERPDEEEYAPAAKPSQARPAPPPAEPTSSESVTSMPGSVTRAVGGFFDKLTSGGGEAANNGPRYTALSIAAEQIPQRQRYSDPTLPAVSAGGFDWVYDAPLPATVPSQANQLRVPLAGKRYDVTTFYEATPALAKTAYLKATVKNGSKLPLLYGSANVFVKKAFAGDAIIKTTGPGGTLELPLGADEDIRLTRTVVPQTKTQGFIFGQEDVTDYVVTMEIGNYKKKAVTVRVVDVLPKSNNEKVKVELVSTAPALEEKAPNGEGLMYWHVDVGAGKTQKVTFTYRITRPKDWRLTQ